MMEREATMHEDLPDDMQVGDAHGATEEQLHALQERLIHLYIMERIHQDILAIVMMEDATEYQRDPEQIAKFAVIMTRVIAQYTNYLMPMPDSYLLWLQAQYRDPRTPSEELWRLAIINMIVARRAE